MIEKENGYVTRPHPGGDPDGLSLVDELSADFDEFLPFPALDPLLPGGKFLQAFHPPLSLVYQHCHVPHSFQSLLHFVVVWMLRLRVFEQFRQLERIFAYPLDGGQKVPIEWYLYQASHQTAGLEKFAVAISLVKLLQGRYCHRMTVAVLGIHSEARPL